MISSAISAAAPAWSGRGSGAPATAIYASPTVLLFSIPTRSANSSNRVNTSSSTTTNSCGAMREACSVNLTRSAKRTVTLSMRSAICAASGAVSPACNRSTIEPGNVLRSRSSARRRARSNYRSRRNTKRVLRSRPTPAAMPIRTIDTRNGSESQSSFFVSCRIP